MSAGHVGGIRGSGIVSSAANVLWMSVVRGMRAVGGVCEMCMCLGRSWWRRGNWMRGLSLGFTNPVESVGVLDVCLCFGCGCGGVGGIGGEWVGAWNANYAPQVRSFPLQ